MAAPSPEGWVVLRTFFGEFEARLVQGRLLAAGLPAVLLSQWDRSFGLLLGERAGIYVLVRSEDRQRAERFLAETMDSSDFPEEA
ncbi:MAG: hypothetical protein N2561_06065 [Bacteroidetes bacterium]|nr:hypothetical protein [Rhodothermia bacterium]MCS7154758.1 hypothetical protein [Bacteroidota bacterium]MCX7907085.1 hypothetical protein [Bacteroidota bacterium]MDW8137551.1 hypothetical protein [Bacteroidota bacterium]MDW8285495.1 hypothetical protein [Bacteroidota bacterium]